MPQPIGPIQPLEGHQFGPVCNPDSTRMSFTNIHGLRSTKTTLQDSVQDMISAQLSFDVQISGITEHHLPLNNPKMSQQLFESMHSGGGTSSTSQLSYRLDSSQETSGGRGRLMGGTGIIAYGPMAGRLEPKGKEGDSMGRWSSMTLRRNGLPPLTVFLVYQVCPTTTNPIGHTAWHQQQRSLDLSERNIHPRKALIEDLSCRIHQLQMQGHALIIGGDWNKCDHHTQSGLLRLCTTHNLVDPWRTLYPQFGIHRIDSVIMSRSLLPAVQRVGYTPLGFLRTQIIDP